jgi:MraZ protein
MAELSGTYNITLDANRRLALPSKLYYSQEDDLRDRVKITRGVAKCLTGYYRDEWKSLVASINKLNIDEKSKQIMKRHIIGAATDCELDKQRRLILPENLVAYAELPEDGEVLVVGCGEVFEIWNPALYEEDAKTSEETIQDIFGRISLSSDKTSSPELN